jgi:hypothetical protein
MIAALICSFSIGAFLQFLVSYCRSIVLSSRQVEVSDRVFEVAHVQSRAVAANDFERFLPLVRLCANYKQDRASIRAVGTYYRVLNAVSRASGAIAPRLAAWAERERQHCSYFAAVALDRRIAYSRELCMQQASNSL